MRFVIGCIAIVFGFLVAAFGGGQFWIGLTSPESVLPRPSNVPHAAESLQLMNEYLDRSKDMEARDAPIGERRQALEELRAGREALQRREQEAAQSAPRARRWMIVAVGALGAIVGGSFVLDGVRRMRPPVKIEGTPVGDASDEEQRTHPLT